MSNRKARTSSSSGSFRSAGCCSGSGLLLGAITTSTRLACNSSITTRSQRPASPRLTDKPRQPTPVSVTLSLPPGSLICTRRASKSPSSRPFGASTCTPGSSVSSQALPASLRSAQPMHTAAVASSSASVATPANNQRSPCRGFLKASAGAGSGSDAASASLIRTRSRCSGGRAPCASLAHTPGRRAAARPGCASARPRRSPGPDATR